MDQIWNKSKQLKAWTVFHEFFSTQLSHDGGVTIKL